MLKINIRWIPIHIFYTYHTWVNCVSVGGIWAGLAPCSLHASSRIYYMKWLTHHVLHLSSWYGWQSLLLTPALATTIRAQVEQNVYLCKNKYSRCLELLSFVIWCTIPASLPSVFGGCSSATLLYIQCVHILFVFIHHRECLLFPITRAFRTLTGFSE